MDGVGYGRVGDPRTARNPKDLQGTPGAKGKFPWEGIHCGPKDLEHGSASMPKGEWFGSPRSRSAKTKQKNRMIPNRTSNQYRTS